MKTNLLFFYALIVSVSISGCATTYSGPNHKQQSYERTVKDPDVAINSLKKYLASKGYTITSSGKEVISTAPKNVSLSHFDADCGKTMGLDYLKDARTSTTASINIYADGDTIKVVTDINAKYLTGNMFQSKTMHCVSRGTIERRVLSQLN